MDSDTINTILIIQISYQKNKLLSSILRPIKNRQILVKMPEKLSYFDYFLLHLQLAVLAKKILA